MCTQWVNQAAVRRDRLYALKLTLPPLAEQKRVASVRSVVQRLREYNRELAATLNSALWSSLHEATSAQ